MGRIFAPFDIACLYTFRNLYPKDKSKLTLLKYRNLLMHLSVLMAESAFLFFLFLLVYFIFHLTKGKSSIIVGLKELK